MSFITLMLLIVMTIFGNTGLDKMYSYHLLHQFFAIFHIVIENITSVAENYSSHLISLKQQCVRQSMRHCHLDLKSSILSTKYFLKQMDCTVSFISWYFIYNWYNDLLYMHKHIYIFYSHVQCSIGNVWKASG